MTPTYESFFMVTHVGRRLQNGMEDEVVVWNLEKIINGHGRDVFTLGAELLRVGKSEA